jgi:hypothetical protein
MVRRRAPKTVDELLAQARGFAAWAAAGLPLIIPGDSQPQPGRRLLP